MARRRATPTKAPPDLDARVAELYGGPLPSFVTRRDALARELRAAGDREGAAAVKALRKPRAVAWALDAGAHADPGALDRLRAAVDGVVEAQGGAGDLRGALDELRRAEQDLVAAAVEAAAGHGRPVDRTAVGAALRAVVGNPEALADLLAVRLVDAEALPDPGLAPVAAPAAGRGRATGGRGRRRPAGRRRRTGEGGPDAPAGPDPAAVAAAAQAVDAAEEAVTAAEEAAHAAAADAAAAEEAARAAEAEAADARRRADEARDAARRARDAAAARAAARDEAARALAEARAELEVLSP
ncbi:MAG: hypothetical protein FWJ94_05985 [Acidimicrobiia bacterium]